MKNTIKLIGVIAFLAIIGFSFTACGGSDDDKNNGGGDGVDNSNGDTSWSNGTWDKAPFQLVINGNNFTIKNNAVDLYKGTISFTGNESAGSFVITVSHIWGDGQWNVSTGLTDNGTYTKSNNTLTLIGMSQPALAAGNGAWTKTDSGSTGGGNPFIGTWTGNGMTLVCTDSTWSNNNYSGTYTHSGNSAIFTETTIVSSGLRFGTATVSGNTMTLIVEETDVYTLTKGSDVSNYNIGDTGPGGGKIFYKSATGFTVYQNASDTTGTICYYLEAAPVAQGSLAWASSSYQSTDISGTGTSIGTGKKNTALILATDANAPAAKACNNYSNNGKNDWFLPSRYELEELYNQRTTIGLPASIIDGVPRYGNYFSSSQYDNTLVWEILFGSDTLDYYDKKEFSRSVHAIRAF